MSKSKSFTTAPENTEKRQRIFSVYLCVLCVLSEHSERAVTTYETT